MQDTMMKAMLVLLLAAGLAGCAGQAVNPQTSVSPEARFPAPHDAPGGYFN